MRAIFLADAHLRDPADANYRALLDFFARQEECTDLLVLLGDICEFLVGHPKTVFPNYVPLFEALSRLQSHGTQLVYVEGNHDFHLAAGFRNRFPCRVLPDGGLLDLAGKPVLVVHGDLANPADRGYRALRRVLRSLPVKVLIRLLPAGLIWQIAERMSAVSKRSRHDKSRRWPARDILLPYARARFDEGCQAVVTGHFHQPFHERMEHGELIALGDWITQYSYAVWEDGHFRLESYTPADIPPA